MQSGAGADALLPDAAFTAAGATVSADAARGLGLRRGRHDRAAGPAGDPRPGRGLDPDRLPRAARPARRRRARWPTRRRPRSRWRRSRGSRARSRWTRCPRSRNVAGYRAALLGAEEMGRFYPMLMTAAGTIPPAKVLVLGVGVAGLQALATAQAPRRAGRPATTCAPRSPSRSNRSARMWLDLGLEASGEGGYARELTERGARRAAAGADRRDQGLRRRDHDRARARAARRRGS